MCEDTTYNFFLFLLRSHNYPTDIDSIMKESNEVVDNILSLTEQFIHDVLNVGVSSLPPQKQKRLSLLFSIIKNNYITYRVIGRVHSIFAEPNGTPRQGYLVPHSKAYIQFEKWVVPEVATKGIEEYSNLIILFKFHLNVNRTYHPLVIPPKRGEKTSVFTTRSPHRPNNIGLTVAKIDKMVGDKLYLTGIDLIEGTPIIDIKPYTWSDSIPKEQIMMPDWLCKSTQAERINVTISDEARSSIEKEINKLDFYDNIEEYLTVVKEVLSLDIRTIHMKSKHVNKNYGVLIDKMNINFKYTDDGITVIDAQFIETPGKYSQIKK